MNDDYEVISFDLNGLLRHDLEVKVCCLKWSVHLSRTHSSQKDEDSTGMRPFGAALCLSWLLQSSLRNVSSKVSAVIELGCGHGLCGVLAHKLLRGSLDRSAVPCFLTDGEERALELARRTVDANGLGGAKENLIVSRLRWGDREDCSAVLGQVMGAYDHGDARILVLAADLIYMNKPVDLLFSTISALVGSHGACLMSFSPRELNWQEKVCRGIMDHHLTAHVVADDTGIPEAIKNSTTSVVNVLCGRDRGLLTDLLESLPGDLRLLPLEEWKKRNETQETDEEWCASIADDCFS